MAESRRRRRSATALQGLKEEEEEEEGGCNGARGSVALVVAKAPKRRRKAGLTCVNCSCDAKADASNWYESDEGDRGRATPKGSWCADCGDYAEASRILHADLVKTKKRSAGLAQKHDEELAEFLQNRADPDKRDFEPEEIRFESEVESTLCERYKFISRVKFKEHNKIFPDEAGLGLVSVMTKKGDAQLGIAVQIDGEEPTLEVRTRRRYVRSSTVFDKSEHLYKGQADRVYLHYSSQFGPKLGQSIGDRYKGKKQSVQHYTEADVRQHMLDFKQKRCAKESQAMAGMTAVEALLHSAGHDSDMGEGEEEESCEHDMEEEELKDDDDEPPPRSKRPMAACSSKEIPTAVTRGRPLVKDEKTATPVKRGRSVSSVSPGSVGGDDMGGIDDVAKMSRTKPATHWMAVLQPSAVLREAKSFEREMRFANECVTRTARAGYDIEASGHTFTYVE